jgi:hypothetical protein
MRELRPLKLTISIRSQEYEFDPGSEIWDPRPGLRKKLSQIRRPVKHWIRNSPAYHIYIIWGRAQKNILVLDITAGKAEENWTRWSGAQYL